MQSKDIKVGETYAIQPNRSKYAPEGATFEGRIIAKGVEFGVRDRSVWTHRTIKKKGIEVEVVTPVGERFARYHPGGTVGERIKVESRAIIATWSKYQEDLRQRREAEAERAREAAERDARIEALKGRVYDLGVKINVGTSSYGTPVATMSLDDLEGLLERLERLEAQGVER